MPPTLRIPGRYVRGLQALTNLPADEFAETLSSLEGPHDRLATERLATSVANVVASLDVDQAAELLEAVFSLLALLPESGEGAEELAQRISESSDLDADDDETREQVATRLLAMMNIETVRIAGRSLDLMTENARTLHETRIVTEVRPVFGAEVKDGAKAAMVVSELKIEFHDADRTVDAHFYAVDRSDLERLRDVIDRAIDKTDVLKSLIVDAGMPYWEWRDTDAVTD